MPEDAEAERHQKITIQLIVLKQVVARLVAYEARRHPEPSAVFNDMSEAVNKMLDNFPTPTADAMRLAERARLEIDWIVAAAQAILRKPGAAEG